MNKGYWFKMICENCGKEHNGQYASGRFCCKECSKSFSSRHTINQSKMLVCRICGKSILGSCHSRTNVICDECNSYYRKCSRKRYFTNKLTGKTLNTSQCWFCGRELCNDDICKSLTTANVRNLIKYFGFNKDFIGTTLALDEFLRIKLEIYQLYFIDRLPCSELEKRYNYPSHINQNIFPMFGFVGRNLSEAGKLSIIDGRKSFVQINNQYNSGWHTTWMGNEVYLRSSYEKDYAEYLDKEHIKYDVECLRIKYYDTYQKTYRCAIPDFYLPDTNTIVEIKSSWTIKGKVQELKDKFEEYNRLGYNTRLILDKSEIDICDIRE